MAHTVEEILLPVDQLLDGGGHHIELFGELYKFRAAPFDTLRNPDIQVARSGLDHGPLNLSERPGEPPGQSRGHSARDQKRNDAGEPKRSAVGREEQHPGGILEEIHRFSCCEDNYFLALYIERPDAKRVSSLTHQGTRVFQRAVRDFVTGNIVPRAVDRVHPGMVRSGILMLKPACESRFPAERHDFLCEHHPVFARMIKEKSMVRIQKSPGDGENQKSGQRHSDDQTRKGLPEEGIRIEERKPRFFLHRDQLAESSSTDIW